MVTNKKDDFFYIVVVGSTNKEDIRRSVITCSSRKSVKSINKLIKSYTKNGQPYGNWHKEILAKNNDFCIKRIDAISYDVVQDKIKSKTTVRQDYRLKYTDNIEAKGFTIVSGKGSGRDEKRFF